jgi:hypothetical protein
MDNWLFLQVNAIFGQNYSILFTQQKTTAGDLTQNEKCS